MTTAGPRTYPTTVRIGAEDVTLRYMTAADRASILAFARALPEHDLLFLRRDITQDAVVDDWTREVAEGTVTTVLALAGDAVVGYAMVERTKPAWSSHVGELRVNVAERMRGKGLGSILTREAFAVALALGIQKMVAQMTIDQAGAVSVFERLGFRPEAILRDHVRDRAGQKHDLLVLTHAVDSFEGSPRPYGIIEAFDR